MEALEEGHVTCVLLSDRLPLWKGIAERDYLLVAFNGLILHPFPRTAHLCYMLFTVFAIVYYQICSIT